MVPDRLGAEADRREVRCGHPGAAAAPRTALHHRSVELEDRLHARAAVRLDVQPDTDTKGRQRVYLRVSWVRSSPQVVDLAGNPMGRPVRVPLNLAGLSTQTRDGRRRAAVTAVLEHAKATGASAIAVEDLDFAGSRSREKLGRRKAFRHLIHGFPPPSSGTGSSRWRPPKAWR